MKVDGPSCPAGLVYLWTWYGELLAGASAGGGFGPPTIGWPDILAWCQLTGTALQPWEARALLRIDVARSEIAAEKSEADRRSRDRPVKGKAAQHG